MAQTTLLSLVLTPTAFDGHKLMAAAMQLRAEDPSLALKTDSGGGITICGLGELHLEIAVRRLTRDFGVRATVSKPRVIYKQGPTGLLEPLMHVEVQAPPEYIASIIDNLSRRRGTIQAPGALSDGARVVSAHVPLAEMLGYAADLRARTIGRGTFSMRLERYQPCEEPGGDDRASLVGAPRTPAPTLRTSSIALPEPDDDLTGDQV